MASNGRTDLHAVAEARLARAELRYTSGRRTVVDALAALGGPSSIEDLAREVPELPRSSAYRHLVDLQHAGVVRRIAGPDDHGRFELAEDITEHHHHVICTDCGRVEDIVPPPELERIVGRHLDELATQLGFEPLGHQVDILGRCARCRPGGNA